MNLAAIILTTILEDFLHTHTEDLKLLLTCLMENLDTKIHRNEGYLTDGSVQWMTAGKGIVHSEMPEQTNGLVRGFQLWLNLPQKKKMIDPAYNDIPSDKIPNINIPGGLIKIIAGSYSGVKGPGKSHTGILYFDIRMNRGSKLEIPIDLNWNTFCYVYEGEISCGKKVKKIT